MSVLGVALLVALGSVIFGVGVGVGAVVVGIGILGREERLASATETHTPKDAGGAGGATSAAFNPPATGPLRRAR